MTLLGNIICNAIRTVSLKMRTIYLGSGDNRGKFFSELPFIGDIDFPLGA